MLLLPSETTNSEQRKLVVAFVFFARCSVTMLFLVVFVYFSEYYPTVIRSTAIGFGSSLGRIAGMITTLVAEDIKLDIAMVVYAVLGFLSFSLTLTLPQDTTGLKLRDHVDRGDIEMSSYSRNTVDGEEEQNQDKVKQLHSGIKGKLQQMKAYTFNPWKN